MFRDAKVGDRVWSIQHGWCRITEIRRGEYPIWVEGGVYNRNIYTSDGRLYLKDKAPSLFWDEAKIIPPPRPKRKVKKVIEGWVNIYSSGFGSQYGPGPIGGSFHATREGAIKDRPVGSGPLGEPMFVRHEYEAEEEK